MGRKAIIFLIVYCFMKLVSGQIWTGTCGRPAVEKLESWFSSRLGMSKVNGIHELSTIVLPYTHGAPTQFHHILDTNTWLISITNILDPTKPSVIGHAALIRVHLDVEESDIAITSGDMCRTPISNYGYGYEARFGAYDSKHGFYDQVGIVHCWHHPDYDPLQPGRNNVGILKLAKKIPFTDRIEPICLPGHNERITFKPGVQGTVVGVSNSDATIHQFNLKITGQRKCKIQTKGLFCVEPITANEREDNWGLDGAPFVSTINGLSTIMGIVIQGGKHTLAEPTSISRLSPFLEPQGWLEQTIRERSGVWAEHPMN